MDQGELVEHGLSFLCYGFCTVFLTIRLIFCDYAKVLPYH